jgi:hypothetical protein
MKCKSWAVTGLILTIVFALIACGKGSDSGPDPTYSISGTATLDGNALQGVAITLSGASSAATNTDAGGNYTFEKLPAGTYTLTPSLAGYNYSPSSPTVTINNANLTQNFTAASAVTSYSISGTIIYSGSHTGRIYVGLKNSNGGATGHGTSIASPGAFTIRGVTPGTYYKLSAEMDIRGDGTLNADNPSGEILTINVTNANLIGKNITLTDPAPATPVTPTGLRVNPSDGAAMICWDVMRTNYKIIAKSYKIYWGTDTNATTGTPITVSAGSSGYMQSIANGVYFYKISALVGTTESAPSAVVGPITIGPGVGLNTVSGTVTIGVTPTGPLYVGVYEGDKIYYFTRINSPAASQTYSLSGLPNGTYRAFAVLNQINYEGTLDPSNDTIGEMPILINNDNPTKNMTISAANAVSHVATEHWIKEADESLSGYVLRFNVGGMIKLPVQVSLTSGQNIPVPMDMQKANNSRAGFSCSINIGGIRPALTDTYRFDVTYADGTTEQLTAPVTAVLDSFAQIIGITGTDVPTFYWSAPTSPPAFYSYYIAVYDSTTGNLIWYYPTSSPFGMPSTQTSVLYNVDGRASQSTLPIGTLCTVYIIVMDEFSNSARYGISLGR